MENLLEKSAGMEMSLESQEEHCRNEKIAAELFKESELLEIKIEEWKEKVSERLNSGLVMRSEKRELDREGRKLRKKLDAVAFKLELLSDKNIKGIIKEVRNYG